MRLFRYYLLYLVWLIQGILYDCQKVRINQINNLLNIFLVDMSLIVKISVAGLLYLFLVWWVLLLFFKDLVQLVKLYKARFR